MLLIYELKPCVCFILFKWTNQIDAAISQVFCFSFKYSSTFFGYPHAHHQELNNSLWFTVATWWYQCCWSWSGRSAGRPARPPTSLLPPRSNGKPEAATAVVKLLMLGMRMPEKRWVVFKRQAINLRNCCI